MSARSLRMRSQTARFLGALLGLVLYVVLVFVAGPQSSDPTSNTGLWWFLGGLVFAGLLGAWFLPWLRKRFSARYARRRQLR
jgi:lipopolysaccharide export LptBFGC system permease protein LptF